MFYQIFSFPGNYTPHFLNKVKHLFGTDYDGAPTVILGLYWETSGVDTNK
jgi:hypothetical protein